jgi:diadenosine tetraphosphate (Ap4A) HIT family hydrolase
MHQSFWKYYLSLCYTLDTVMSEPSNYCQLCERVSKILKDDGNPFLIHEFPHSVFVIGDHQFFRGYSLLLFKQHARELHELEPSVQSALFAELMIAGRAVANTIKPWKMNYSCYGNAVPHIHWHLFPRYASDPNREQVP